MDRRAALRAIGIGTVSAVAGCLGSATEPDASVASIETSYPTVAGAQYYVHGEPVDDPDESPVRFESLSPQARLEVANGIVRPQYVTSRSPDILDSTRTVEYRGTAFTIGAGVADGFRRRDPDVFELVSLDARIVDSELVIELINDRDGPLTVSHYGYPCFGVLTAVNGTTATLLDHGLYEVNDAVRTDGIVRTDERYPRDRTETIAPGEPLRESYRIDGALPDESTVWFSAPIETEAYSEILAATISLEA